MGFRKYTTYNTHDTTYSLAERHTVRNGVKERAARIINTFSRNRIALGARNIVDQFHKVGLTSYTYDDIYSVMRKLEGLGVLERDAEVSYLYRLAPDGKAIWKAAIKS